MNKYLLIFALFVRYEGFSQKNITEQDLIWYGYFQTFQINQKSNLQTEIQERHFVKPFAQHQFLMRGHYHRLIENTNWEASVGFAFFLQNPNNPNSLNKLTTPELRPHFELSNNQKVGKLILDHRYRAEARFFDNINTDSTKSDTGYNFENYRFRYRLQVSVPIFKRLKNSQLKLKLSDEILINAGNNIVKNVFDQNRIYFALSASISSNFTIEAGYLKLLQQRNTGDFYARDILRFTAFHKINFKKNIE